MGISIKITGLDSAVKNIARKSEIINSGVVYELNAWADNTSKKAKDYAPTDEGHLKGSINPTYASKGKTIASVTVAANYAAYVEFGTRKFAAEYVGTLPQDWQQMAAIYKGKGGGDFYDFLNNILDWVIRKGIANRYSVKTQRVISINLSKPSSGGVGKSDYERLHDTAYAIALSILRKGIKPHPFLYPAYNETKDKLLKNIKEVISK